MSGGRHPAAPPPDVTMGHEERDVAPRPIVYSVLGLTALAVLAVGAMLLLLNFLAAYHAARTAAPSPLAESYGLKEPPEPRLQTQPVADLDALRARDAALLDSYGWVDRNAGVVRIPVERAIEILAARGLPARPAAPQEAP
jgi:hypothetical protein